MLHMATFPNPRPNTLNPIDPRLSEGLWSRGAQRSVDQAARFHGLGFREHTPSDNLGTLYCVFSGLYYPVAP